MDSLKKNYYYISCNSSFINHPHCSNGFRLIIHRCTSRVEGIGHYNPHDTITEGKDFRKSFKMKNTLWKNKILRLFVFPKVTNWPIVLYVSELFWMIKFHLAISPTYIIIIKYPSFALYNILLHPGNILSKAS